MKIYKFLLVTVTSFFFFFASSVFAVYGQDDVSSDIGEKTTSFGTEIEVNEFVLLDAMPDIELYYYPYSATDADQANGEDVPGGEGSVYVGGGIIKWHANIDTTISIDDLILTNIDTSETELNTIEADGVGINIGVILARTKSQIDNLNFTNSAGTTLNQMGYDMTTAYNNRAVDGSSQAFPAEPGHTDFAGKFYLALTLGASGSVQSAGIYRATATVRAMPTVSS